MKKDFVSLLMKREAESFSIVAQPVWGGGIYWRPGKGIYFESAEIKEECKIKIEKIYKK